MKRLLLYVLVLLAMASCKKIISIDDDYQKPKIVLNGAFELNDDSISIFVTESQMIHGFHKGYRVVDDAVLSLYENDAKLGSFSLSSDSIVRSEYDPAYGTKYDIVLSGFDKSKRYAVTLEHPTMGQAYAETTFPQIIQVDSVVLEVCRISDYDKFVNALVAKVTFTDPAGEANYYQVYQGGYDLAQAYVGFYYDEETGSYQDKETDTLILRHYSIAPSYSQIDPLIAPNENELLGGSENLFMVFNDELIDGKSYTLQVVLKKYVDDTYLENIDTTKGEYLSYDIGLCAINRDTYLYYRSIDAFHWNDDSPFAEPVQIYSNVDNGLGLFYGYCKSNSHGHLGTLREDRIYLTPEDIY